MTQRQAWLVLGSVLSVLALGLAGCATDVEDPLAPDPQPKTFTPVQVTLSADPPPSPAEPRITEDGTAAVKAPTIDLELPDFPQPAR